MASGGWGQARIDVTTFDRREGGLLVKQTKVVVDGTITSEASPICIRFKVLFLLDLLILLEKNIYKVIL